GWYATGFDWALTCFSCLSCPGAPSSFHPDMDFLDLRTETDALLPAGFRVTIVVVYMIVCVFGLVGNFLVMYVIISKVFLIKLIKPTPVNIDSLGTYFWHLRLPLLLPHPHGHHQHLLQPDGKTPSKCSHPVRLQGKGSQPAAHHQDGPGGGGGVCRLLDAHPHLGPGSVPGLHSEEHVRRGHVSFLHRSGLHQQWSESRALRFSGRKLQALLP
uniref:Uncharacterized protein n=1 Tax=Xiphophorus couchianus TaxID=32473 RepID=A0A3B5MC69_9TELE